MHPSEGHFSHFFLNLDECHRQIFLTISGSPEGIFGNSDMVSIEDDE